MLVFEYGASRSRCGDLDHRLKYHEDWMKRRSASLMLHLAVYNHMGRWSKHLRPYSELNWITRVLRRNYQPCNEDTSSSVSVPPEAGRR